MYRSAIKELYCVSLLLCMVYYGQGFFLAQPPSVVKATAGQPVTQLECQAQCWLPYNDKDCTIRWFRWTEDGKAEPLSDNCHNLPYSEWRDRQASTFRVTVRSKLIINKFGSAYSGLYFCSLITSRNNLVSNNVSLKAAKADNPIVVNPVQNCCLPSIQDIKAPLKLSKDSMCTNVSWIEVPGDCETQPWMLAVLEWDDIPSYDFADDDDRIKSLTVVNGSWSVVCGLNLAKYYQFQLSTMVESHNTSLMFGSHTFFFGSSSPAKITEVPQYQEVMEGDQLEIKCVATGVPTPDVQFVKVVSAITDQTGIDTVQMSPSESTVLRSKIIEHAKLSDSGDYSCIASNTLVNPPRGIRKTTSTATFTVKVIKRSETKSR